MSRFWTQWAMMATLAIRHRNVEALDYVIDVALTVCIASEVALQQHV